MRPQCWAARNLGPMPSAIIQHGANTDGHADTNARNLYIPADLSTPSAHPTEVDVVSAESRSAKDQDWCHTRALRPLNRGYNQGDPLDCGGDCGKLLASAEQDNFGGIRFGHCRLVITIDDAGYLRYPSA